MLQKYLKKDYFDEKMILLDFIAKILKVMLMI